MNTEEVKTDLHEQWLQHPITGDFLKMLKKHRETMVNQMVSDAFNFSVDPSKFRMLSYGIKTLDTVAELITKPQTVTKITQ